MESTVELDETDAKILRELTRDARTKLKDLAKVCGVSSSAISVRLKHLRKTGVITGAVQFVNMDRLRSLFPASIGITIDPYKEARVMELIRKKANTIVLSTCIGKDDIISLVVVRSIQELNMLQQNIRKQEGVRKTSVNLWSTPYFNFGNIDIKTTRS